MSFADIIDCDFNSCNGNGVCVEVKGGGFICQCEPGWKGFNCSVNIDDCKPNPCANGAACIDGLLDYDCICTAGWTGKTCNVGEWIVFRIYTLSQKPDFPIKCNMRLF